MKNTKEISFSGSHFFIGIDTHLKNWRVTIRLDGIELKTFSMNPSAVELSNYLNKHYPDGIYHLVYEAGFCGFWPSRKFKELGLDCIIVNPADVPTSNKEKVNKNDPIDSRKLARELENKSLHGIYKGEKIHEELRNLVRLRFHIIQNQTRLKNRIKGLLHTQGIAIPTAFAGNSRWSAAFILWLKEIKLSTDAGNFTLQNVILQLQQLREHNKNVLRELRKQTAENNVIKSLLTVPGIGFITAITLYSEIVDMKRFSSQAKLAAFVGLVPSTRSSDDTIYGNGISFRRNKFLRPIMIEAAWTAVKRDPAMTLKYKELSKRMKPQDAIVRIARKLVQRVRHVWLNNEEYTFSLVA